MLYQRFFQVSCFVSLFVVSISGFSQTKVVVIPLFGDDAPEVPAAKSVFLTKATFQGNFGGPVGADQICQQEADAVGSVVQGKTFKAWISGPRLSDYSDSGQLFTKSTGPYQLVGGSVLWDSYDDLITSDPAAPISNSADGVTLPPEVRAWVWTGLNNDGTYASDNAHCSIGEYWEIINVGSTFYLGAFGEWDTTTEWTDSAGAACSALARLYCFEQ